MMRKMVLILAFAASWGGITSLSAQTSFTWVGSTGGEWHNAVNWNPQGIPGSDDTAIINSGSVVINSEAEVSALSFSGTLTINSTLTPRNIFTWTSGNLTGPGTLNIPGDAVWNLSTAGGKNISGALTINQAGTANWSGATLAQSSHTGVINNTGLFDMQGDLTLGTFNALGGEFNNTGVLRKSAGTGTGTISSSVRLTNTGTIEVLAGALNIASGLFNPEHTTLHTGTIIVADTAELRFGGGNHRLPEGGLITGPGGGPIQSGLTLNAGLLTLDAPLNLQGAFTMASGTLVLNNDYAFPTLSFAGTVVVNNSLTITGALNWTSGNLTGPGTLNIPGDALWNLSTAGGKNISGALTINQAGTVNWSGPQGATISQSSHTGAINNSGLFDMQGDLTLGTFNAFGGEFNNTGVLRKSAGTGSTGGFIYSSVLLTNTGTIEVLAGALNIASGQFNAEHTTLHTGTIIVADTAELRFGGGNHRLPEGGLITGPGGGPIQGRLTLNTGLLTLDAPLNLLGPFALNNATLVLNNDYTFPSLSFGGTVVVNNSLTITEALNWTFGNLTGPGTLNIPGDALWNISSAGGTIISGALTINQAGTVNWSGPQGATISQSSHTGAINNSGLFDMQGDLTLGTFNAFGGEFNNTGVLRKSAGTGSTGGFIYSSVLLTNTGTIEVLAGALNIASGQFNAEHTTLHTGTIIVADTAELRFGGGNHRLPEGGLITGPGGGPIQGRLTLNTGLLTLDAPLNLLGPFALNNATLVLNNDYTFPSLSFGGTVVVNNSLTITEALNWTFGNLTGPGTLNIPGDALWNISSAGGTIISGALTINQAGTVNWSGPQGATISQSSHTGAINNSGLFDMQGDLTLGTFNAFGGEFNNTGVLRKSAGTGSTGGFIYSSVLLTNTGTIEVLAGALNIASGQFDASIEQLHTGAFLIEEQNELRFTAGTHRIGEAGVISGEGTLALTGGTFLNDGTISPGSSTGVLNVTGNIPISSTSSVLLMDVAGTQPGSGYDQLLVTGAANLGGNLSVRLDDNFQPESSQEFTVLRAGSVNNEFSNVQLTGNGSGIPVSATYTDTTVVVRFTPAELLPPVAVNDTAFTTGGTPVTINVLANDSDPMGRPISITEVAQPGNGSTEITQNNQIRYTPAAGFIGTDQFAYTISNDAGLTASAQVTVFVQESGTGETYTWVGGNGNWSTASNWNPAGVPGINDEAIVSSGGVIIDTPQVVARLSLTSVTIEINSQLTVLSQFAWSGGTLAGSGTLALASTLTGTISSINTKTISGALVIGQAGTLTWSGGQIAQSAHTGAFNNSGLLDIQGDLTLGTFNAFGGTFNNTGTLRKSAGEGTAVLQTSVRLANAGTIEALSGILSISSISVAGSSTPASSSCTPGHSASASRASCDSAAGTHRITESGEISGPGGVPFTGVFSQSGGTLTMDGQLLSGGQVNLSGGTFAVNATAATPNLGVAGSATLAANGSLTVTDTFAWSGGTLAGSGTLALASTLTGTISSINTKTISGALVIGQAGTLTWSGGQIAQSAHTGAFNNSGLLDIQGDLTLGTFNAFGGTFNNTGTLRKSAGEGTAVLQTSVRLANAGTIEALSGILSIGGGQFNTGIEQLHTGAFRIGEQGELRFAAGTHRITESGEISGPGGVPFTGVFSQSGGTLTMDGQLLSGGQVNLSGGTFAVNATAATPNLGVAGSATLAANGSLTVTDTFAWSGGTLAGSGTLALASTLTGTISSINTKTISGALVIGQAGTLTWSGGQIAQSAHTGAFNNSGLLDIQGDLTLGTFNAFGGTFNNTGTLRKSAGEGTAVLQTSVRLANAGTIEALSGILSIGGGQFNTGIEQLHTGAFRIGEQGELRFAAGTHRITESGEISGPGGVPFTGVFSQSGGTLTMDGQLLSGGQVNLSGGTFAVNATAATPNLGVAGSATLAANGSLTVTDTFAWSGGTLAGSGTLALASTLTGTISSINTKTISGALVIGQAGTLTWSGGQIAQSAHTGAFNNSGLLDIQGDLTLGTFNAFGGTFNNTGTLRKSAGEGTAVLQTSVRLANAGTIEALSGILSIGGGQFNTGIEQLHTGAFRIGEQGELRFAAGTHRITESGEISGPGGVPFTGVFSQSGGTLTMDGQLLSGGQVNLSGGTFAVNATAATPNLGVAGSATLAANGSLTVTDTFAWSGGTLAGSGTLALASTLTGTISSINTKTISGALVIGQAGTLTWSGGQIAQSAHTGAFNNSGLLDIQGDLTLGTFNAFGGTFNNTGTLRKSAGEGTAVLQTSVRLANAGTIEALSGILSIGGGQFNTGIEQLHTGAFRIGEQGELRFAAGTHRITGSGVISGEGTLALSGGTFLNDGTISPGLPTGILNVTGNIPLTSSTSALQIGLAGNEPGVNQDQLIVSGSANLGGNLVIDLANGFEPEAGQDFTVLRAASVNNEFSSVQLSGTDPNNSISALYTDTTVVVRFSAAEPVPPIAVNDSAFTLSGSPVNISVLTNDSDPQGRQITVTGVTQPENGTSEIIPGNLVRYTPVGEFTGTDQFEYTIANTAGLTATALVTVFVQEAGEGEVYTWVGGTGNWSVASNWNPAGVPGINDQAIINTGNVTSDSPLAVSRLTLNSTLIVNSILSVNDTFIWTNGTLSGSGSVSIPEDASWNMTAGSSRTLDGTLTINMNGTASLAAGFFGLATSAGIVFNNTGLFDLQSDLGFGTGGTGVFRMTLNNTGIFRKSAGEATGSISSTVRLNNPGTIEVLSGRLDINSGQFTPGDSLTYQGTFIVADEAALFFGGGIHTIGEQAVISGPDGQPSGGTVGVFANGGIGSPRLTLNGDIRVNGTISQTSGTLTINPTGLITGNTTILLSSGTFINNGTLSPGDPLGIINVTGNLPFSSASSVLEVELGGDEPGTSQDQVIVSGSSGLNGTLSVLVTDGFVPEPGQEFVVLRAGAISGTFSSISHPDLGEDRIFLPVYTDSTVAVRFTGAEITRPIAIDDSVSTPFNTAVSINVLANDISPAGDPLSIIAVTQPANGTAGISGDSLITYTPASGFSGVDSFIYTISSDRDEVDSARVTVTVLEQVIINNAPVAVNDTASTVLNLPVLVDVLANDSDPDGDPVSVLGFENPTDEGGNVVLTGDDRLLYTPPTGFTGSDRFRYSITDGRGGADTALVVIEVFPVRFEVVMTGAPGTRAMAIDEDGAVAGNRVTAGTPVQGFYMAAGSEVFFNTGPFGSQIYGIAGGRMAGIVMVNDTSGTAHLFSPDGTADELGTLGGTFSLGYAVNAAGLVTGVSTDSLGRSRAFITDESGVMSVISSPGFQFSTGYAVNRDGAVAGMVSNPGSAQRAWVSGQVKAEPNSRAYSINTGGDAAGSLENQGQLRAAYWTAAGETVILPSGSEPFAEAYGINDAGWIVGSAGPNPPGFTTQSSISAVPGGLPRSMVAPAESITTIPEQLRAVVWISESLFDLNELIDPTAGWTLLEAASINSSGQIAGTGIHQGSLKAFVLSPVDEEPPLAIDFTEATAMGAELIIDLGSLNGSGVRVVQVSRPDNGTVNITGETTIRYIPASGYLGADRFRYTLSNGRSVSHGYITVAIESVAELPERMMLGQNYPNPFNPGTIIPVNLPETTDVRLEVFDLLGRFVLEVFNGTLEAGEHHLTVDAARLSSGTYIYRLSSTAGIQTRKMTLLK
jgi:fibronectin-binding autotransporter adhesin